MKKWSVRIVNDEDAELIIYHKPEEIDIDENIPIKPIKVCNTTLEILLFDTYNEALAYYDQVIPQNTDRLYMANSNVKILWSK